MSSLPRGQRSSRSISAYGWVNQWKCIVRRYLDNEVGHNEVPTPGIVIESYAGTVNTPQLDRPERMLNPSFSTASNRVSITENANDTQTLCPSLDREAKAPRASVPNTFYAFQKSIPKISASKGGTKEDNKVYETSSVTTRSRWTIKCSSLDFLMTGLMWW